MAKRKTDIAEKPPDKQEQKPNEQYDVDRMAKLILFHHGNITAVARSLKCSRQTIHNYAAKYPPIAEAIQDARDEILDLAESKLVKAIRGDHAWAICFYLKTQGKERGYVERQEMTGKGGGPIATHTMTDAELERIAAGSRT